MPSPSSSPADGAEDPPALDDLLKRTLPQLQAFVRLQVGPELRGHESCADLVQSVCRELLHGREQLTFADEAAFRGWLFTAALNKVRARGRHLHRQRRDVRRLVAGTAGAEALASRPAGDPSPSSAAAAGEQIERLAAAFDRLSQEHREVIALARLLRLPLREVGDRMGGRSPAAVTMLLGRALTALDRILLEGNEGNGSPPCGGLDRIAP